LKGAIEYLPLVGRELLKKKHRTPKNPESYGIEVGGGDQAYYYWERWGRFWVEDPEVFPWLERTLKPKAHRRINKA